MGHLEQRSFSDKCKATGSVVQWAVHLTSSRAREKRFEGCEVKLHEGQRVKRWKTSKLTEVVLKDFAGSQGFSPIWGVSSGHGDCSWIYKTLLKGLRHEVLTVFQSISHNAGVWGCMCGLKRLKQN